MGGNYPFGVGNVGETIRKAITDIENEIGVIRAISGFYETPAFPAGAGPNFVNAALKLETDFAPGALLDALHALEARYGRDRAERWGPRTLDLDLIAYGDLVLPDAETHAKWVDLPLEEQMRAAPDRLILPHPRMAERAFVLVPLNEVASDWCHPISGATVRQMVEDLPEALVSEVVRL